MSDIAEVLKERGKNYGEFEGHARLAQELKIAMRKYSNYSKLNDSQAESLEMIQHKIARILNGDPNYADSWVDIVGYAQLVVEQLNGNNG